MHEWGFFDNFLKNQRIKKATKLLGDKFLTNDKVILDLGCGIGDFLKIISPRIKAGIGIDQKINTYKTGNLSFINFEFSVNKLPLEDNSVDAVIMLACIEHIIYPHFVFKEIIRILKNGGIFVFTTPAPSLDFILVFLSSLRIISKEEIDDHKLYFTKKGLGLVLKDIGFKDVDIKHFQLGLNIMGRSVK
ncbi:MAG: class I SAM-dependent methyltransferase [Candidatus Niyogibacteria bacterium CG10_big_fil_rev_8_21_14_0_10_42_19]|uniref:Class I SAM-dependent methyltransferase n=1 Tax=Candidatus Niyogibacteria bacterium CG10_big_fil_rev_8_21_14_0_10_42_19 TaxID=1974725 RepID=A0A2H0THV4_9BACT|nr:MAG: class I SAM-dependent methyltransferase [Candidatus Niyogibacteria bacterium CG10_big_fil_rev_8_21_14_0_10_42_19]